MRCSGKMTRQAAGRAVELQRGQGGGGISFKEASFQF